MRVLHGWLKRLNNQDVIKETLLPPSSTQYMQLNCKVIKKWQPPSHRFYINPSFSGLSSLFSKIFGTPQVTQFSEGPTVHPFNKGGGGDSNYDTCFQLETIVIKFFQRCWLFTLISFQAVYGWWDMVETYLKPIFNVIYKNRKMMLSSNFKWTSLVKVSIS